MSNDDLRDFPHPLSDDELADLRSTWAASVNANAISAAWAQYAMDGMNPPLDPKYVEKLDKDLTKAFDAVLADMTLDEQAVIGSSHMVCELFNVWLRWKGYAA